MATRVFTPTPGAIFWHRNSIQKLAIICPRTWPSSVPAGNACFLRPAGRHFGWHVHCFHKSGVAPLASRISFFVLFVLQGRGVVAHVGATATLPVLICLFWVQLLLRRGLERRPPSLRKNRTARNFQHLKTRCSLLVSLNDTFTKSSITTISLQLILGGRKRKSQQPPAGSADIPFPPYRRASASFSSCSLHLQSFPHPQAQDRPSANIFQASPRSET